MTAQEISFKRRIATGKARWKFARVFAWTMFIAPGLCLFAVGFSIAVGGAYQTQGKSVDWGFAAIFLVPAFVWCAIGDWIRRRSDKGAGKLICDACGNDTNEHAKVCAQCGARFAPAPP